jgi:type II secretory pathway predicted ATPase ExeA
MKTEMQEEQEIPNPPFDHGLFFPDSGRSATLVALRNAIAEPASLITCVGEEGYGKTTLFKILENEPPESYLVISFPSSVDSFDYILQIIALKLDLTFSVENNTLGSGQLLMGLSRILQKQEKRLMIIIDEAEKLYLATLERIRKMIDLVNTDEVLLQVIFFGRPGLLAHIEQLALCTFRDAREVHLVLPPLTAEDTFQYLNFCMQQSPGLERKNIFSLEVAAKILTMSHGNFRRINSLAADSLRSSSQGDGDTSFMVLLEHVRDIDNPAIEGTPGPHRPFLPIRNKTLLGGGALLLLILLFLLVSRNEKSPAPGSTLQESRISTTTAPPAALTQEQTTQPAPPALPMPASPPTDLPDQASSTPAGEDAALATQPVPDPTAVTIAEPTAAPPAPSTTTETAEESVQQAVESAPPLPPADLAPVAATPDPVIPTISTDKSPQKNKTPLLTQKPVQKNRELLKSSEKSSRYSTNTLPQKSLDRGQKWLSGEKNGYFTLQLMVLSNDGAKDQLATILHNRENQNEADNFIILTKSTSPTTLLLFYGEYPTLPAANNGRDNLPPSLQKYKPYPVSVKQAVTKTK